MDRNPLGPSSTLTAWASPSSRRAWIEIERHDHRREVQHVALLAEGVDRNCEVMYDRKNGIRSPSSRRAWIEIDQERVPGVEGDVALLAEGVDRNYVRGVYSDGGLVALLAEGVDRNCLARSESSRRWVSPSSRRAWIEII